ncbi:MAG: type IV toxin-antitoxin system AbiEi family antitoxin [Pontibacterium sp.]
MMKSDELLTIFAKTVKAGGGIHTAAELAFMLGVPCDAAFIKFLADNTKKGRIRRLVKGIYESTLTPPDPDTAIYKVIKKIRSGVLSYISLESQLSYTGDISQVVMGRVTVVTKGRHGCFDTPYGVIELTHTKKSVEQIASHLYYDSEIKMYRAHKEQAIADLKHCRRNLHMLEEFC